jgi:hypothetical protein
VEQALKVSEVGRIGQILDIFQHQDNVKSLPSRHLKRPMQ